MLSKPTLELFLKEIMEILQQECSNNENFLSELSSLLIQDTGNDNMGYFIRQISKF
jgi:hypothetical protein